MMMNKDYLIYLIKSLFMYTVHCRFMEINSVSLENLTLNENLAKIFITYFYYILYNILYIYYIIYIYILSSLPLHSIKHAYDLICR